jgi:hypothetical protein
MPLELPPIPDAERTPLVEALLAIIDTQQQRIHQLEDTVQQLRDEIAVLKGQQPRPKIAPSRLGLPSSKGNSLDPKSRPADSKRRHRPRASNGPVPRSVPRTPPASPPWR